MHHEGDRILEARLGVRQDQIENAFGFLIHPARHIETGKVDPQRRALVRLYCHLGGDQRILPRKKVFRLILAPLADVEDRPHRG
jgi:hypothetical protein